MRPFAMLCAALCALLCSTSAEAKPWEEKSITAAEGYNLVVMKKGRGAYKVRIDAESGDGIKCGQIFNMLRTPLALNFSAAGTRAEGDSQMGSIVSYQEGLQAMAGVQGASLAPGLCALGLDALAGSVVVTLGSTLKMNGRTATITAAQAKEIGAWLSER